MEMAKWLMPRYSAPRSFDSSFRNKAAAQSDKNVVRFSLTFHRQHWTRLYAESDKNMVDFSMAYLWQHCLRLYAGSDKNIVDFSMAFPRQQRTRMPHRATRTCPVKDRIPKHKKWHVEARLRSCPAPRYLCEQEPRSTLIWFCIIYRPKLLSPPRAVWNCRWAWRQVAVQKATCEFAGLQGRDGDGDLVIVTAQ